MLVCNSGQALTRASAIALYGDPKYLSTSSGFEHVSQHAKPGGEVVLPAFGTFDTLNPYTLKGVSLTAATDQRMWGIDALNEPLMAGSSDYLYAPDEPMSAYCLVCSSVEFDELYEKITFTIDSLARFHDGSPMTADDVAASYHLLTSEGAHPRFSDIYREVERVEVESPTRVSFHIKPGVGRQILFRLGELPVMSSAFWKNRRFGEALTTPPLLSGPYRVCNVELGHSLELCKVPDFWSKGRFFYRHQFNFDRVRYEFFRDRTVAFEAFKSGKLSAWVEYIAKNWATAYDFPSLKTGAAIKQQIPHKIPADYQFFSLNMRRKPFDDVRFRQALSLAFDFEWTNKFLFNDAYKRANTYFPNSEAGAKGVPGNEERALLLSVGIAADDPMLSTAFSLSTTDASGNPRPQLHQAIQLLKAAGYKLEDDQLYTPDNKAVQIEFLVDHPSMARVVLPYCRNLKKIGIETSIRSVDESQYKARADRFDFDVAVYSYPQNLIPSYELRLYFHSSQADTPGSYNYGGVRNEHVDKLLEKLAGASSLKEIYTITSAIDRVLLWNYYTLPQWYLGSHRIAYQAELKHPSSTPPYSLGFPGWWIENQKDTHETHP